MKRIIGIMIIAMMMVLMMVSVAVARPMSSVVREQVERLIVMNEEQISNDNKINAQNDRYIEWLETTDFSERVFEKSDLKKVNNLKKELIFWAKSHRALGDISVKLSTKYNDGYKKALEENDSKYFYKPVSKAEVELNSNIIECERKCHSLDLKLKSILKIYGYDVK